MLWAEGTSTKAPGRRGLLEEQQGWGGVAGKSEGQSSE